MFLLGAKLILLVMPGDIFFDYLKFDKTILSCYENFYEGIMIKMFAKTLIPLKRIIIFFLSAVK